MSEKKVVAIYNPVKINDEDSFRRVVTDTAHQNGFGDPVFITTEPDDPGTGMARRARQADPDLVIVAGGDGTVRTASTELRGSNIPVAIVPSGTGNLMARNIDLPLDEVKAIEVAFTGPTADLDIVELHVDDEGPYYFAGMAGIGLDAAMMEDTNEKVKKVVGPAAYVTAFLRQMNDTPRKFTYSIDGGKLKKANSVLLMVGNTRKITGGIELFPEADPTDGVVELLIASPESFTGWLRVVMGILRKLRRRPSLAYLTARHIEIRMAESSPWEIDGDTEGEGRRFTFDIADQSVKFVVSPSWTPRSQASAAS